MLLDEIEKDKDNILDIFDRYGASNVRIMGSVSKREETELSDIDFVVTLYKLPDGKSDLVRYMGLLKDLESYFKRNIDLADEEQICTMYRKALSEAYHLER
ncbi:nucleotidyltransferase family protein [Paenibacillus xylanilyticus]|uniref:Nucleotidyltransferase n=1 Tax=Paenibacillus xylanilyticus TaxID=248903 RepID=A0A7Y6BU39_9BACL|nr:nucleotidyltransferase domain-containing protein [Paenibacillus xylanilyticus]NUU74613.1 nucleotidyltransferase [Paenibacillus xylanilyticus]